MTFRDGPRKSPDLGRIGRPAQTFAFVTIVTFVTMRPQRNFFSRRKRKMVPVLSCTATSVSWWRSVAVGRNPSYLVAPDEHPLHAMKTRLDIHGLVRQFADASKELAYDGHRSKVKFDGL